MRQKLIGGVMALAVLAGWPTGLVAKDDKATEILAATRKAIGDKKLETLKTLSVEANMQRNLGNFQNRTDVEMLLDLPDKYIRSDVSSGMMNMTLTTGFNGDRAITPAGMRAMPGGAMVIAVGPGAAAHPAEGDKPTPEQLEQTNKTSLRNSRQEISRLMLGWFGATHPSLKAHYSYIGEAESPDGKAYVIDVKDADGFAARLFIDQNSKLPLMVTYQGRQPRVMTMGGPGATRVTTEQRSVSATAEEELKKLREQPMPTVEYSLFFDDWREVDGINFPHVIRRATKGTTEEEWTITKVKVNPKLDAKKFETK
jgi:hypothetical protein